MIVVAADFVVVADGFVIIDVFEIVVLVVVIVAFVILLKIQFNVVFNGFHSLMTCLPLLDTACCFQHAESYALPDKRPTSNP
jgi:hypothetical protein